MESRFRELLQEAVRIAEEYRSDFGAPLKPAPPVTAFRYKKASGKSRAKKNGQEKGAKAAAPRAEAKPEKQEKPDPRIARLEKRLLAARQKLEQAKASSAPTRALEDRVYEIEDEIRLASQAG
ncbi:MAG TPA: hypothetical protein VKE94_05655 [Gemmataceae bacterium]|nr:hypothetical protein [Gemmataceae bacterium]